MYSSALAPIWVVLAVLGATVFVGAWIPLLLGALHARARSIALILGCLLPLWVLIIAALPFTPVWKTLMSLVPCLAVEWGIYRFFVRRTFSWQSLKYMRESARQTILHMILITGSILFLIPFAWLVSTSLKDDSQMSRFPPVWIPTQQDRVRLHGVEYPVYWVEYHGNRLRVAALGDVTHGVRLVEVISKGVDQGQRLWVPSTAMHEVQHFAPKWQNYSDALRFLPPETHYGLVFLINTVEITVLSILGALFSASTVAYGFARLRFPGRDSLFMLVLATMMLPSAVTMMPVFLIFRWLGWIDTLKPLWVPAFFGSAFYIFMLRQFFLGIPSELEDAAKIDGCSFYMIYWRIMLPQIKPALAAVTIMTFMGAWNDFRGPLIYISSPAHETLAYALQLFQNAHGGEPGMMMAASTMVMLPVLVLFFFTQRYFIEGVTLTGIKG
jgi:multiple sugar transport system permease protein